MGRLLAHFEWNATLHRLTDARGCLRIDVGRQPVERKECEAEAGRTYRPLSQDEQPGLGGLCGRRLSVNPEQIDPGINVDSKFVPEPPPQGVFKRLTFANGGSRQ